jgi:hypothetical protein
MIRLPGLLASLLLASCAAPPPGYPPPTDADAEAAYRAGIEQRIASWKPTGSGLSPPSGAIDTPGEYAATVDSTVRFAQDVTTLAVLRSNLAAIVTVRVKGCEWDALDIDEVPEAQRPDFSVEAEHGYRCKVESFHRAEGGGILAYDRTGFLFREGGAFSWLEIDHGPARYARDGEVAA